MASGQQHLGVLVVVLFRLYHLGRLVSPFFMYMYVKVGDSRKTLRVGGTWRYCMATLAASGMYMGTLVPYPNPWRGSGHC
mmetsp:Transcript_29119/g.54525  ORF Transcript_29119/g.54525 Transcript_29119/m.54525 type:complete len:80 (-) Transcript_29119:445-684(-)